jgi:hypothetical protein
MMMSPLADMLWKAFRGVFFTKPARMKEKRSKGKRRGDRRGELERYAPHVCSELRGSE